jgi:hypothetical protein
VTITSAYMKLQDETLGSGGALAEAGLSPTRVAKQLGIGRFILCKRLTEGVATLIVAKNGMTIQDTA